MEESVVAELEGAERTDVKIEGAEYNSSKDNKT